MKSAEIRERLHHYINSAEDKKVKAFYTIIEQELNNEQEIWDNPEVLKELNKRSKDYHQGKVTGKSWKDVKKKILSQGTN